jgi:hypothetical protein
MALTLVVAAVAAGVLCAVLIGTPGSGQRSVARHAESLRPVRVPDGIELRNRGLHMRARFARQGLDLRSAGVRLGVRLTGYGYGATLHRVGSVKPRARANRVVYPRGRVTEWYANTRAGLQQGFTLNSRPVGRRTGALTLALRVSGDGRATRARDGAAVTFTSGRGSVAYRGLAAVDARGRMLHARVELGRRGTLRLRIDDRHARYPLRVDPFFQPAAIPGSRYALSVLGDSPVAYYRLGEAAGPQAYDSSGNGRDASYQSSPLLGSPGALLGDADTAVIARRAGVLVSQSGDELPAGRSSRTLEAWVNYTCCTVAFNLLQYGDLAGGRGFAVEIGDSARTIAVKGATTTVTANTLSDFRFGWHLVAVSYDGATGTVAIYQDAQLVGGGQLGDAATTIPGQGLRVNASDNRLGVDEVAIYATALSAGQIAAHWTAGAADPELAVCAPAPSGPYAARVLADAPSAYYRLGELAAYPRGRVAFDSSSHCVNAAYAGGMQAVMGALASDQDTGLTTDEGGLAVFGSDDQLPAADAPRTIEAWVDYTCCTVPYDIVAYGDVAGGHGFAVGLTDSASAITVSAGSTQVSAPTLGDFREDWHLIDVTYDGATVEIYQDGQIIGGGQLGAAGTVAPGQGLRIAVNGFRGKLDEVAIYPSALSPQRVGAHWRAQSLTAPGMSILAGTARMAGGAAAQGARVQACPTAGAECIVAANPVDSSGVFRLLVPDGTYTVTIFPPFGTSSGPQTTGPVTVPPSNQTLTATFAPPAPLPAGMSFSSPGGVTQEGVVPRLNWGELNSLTVPGCIGGGGRVYIRATNTTTGQLEMRAAELRETPVGSGSYAAEIPPLAPLHGLATLDPRITCVGHTQLVPEGGPRSGGTSLLVFGTGFTGATALRFGTTPASAFSVVNDNLIVAAVPAGTGTVPVTVTSSSGASLNVGDYRYYDVTSIDVSTGPSTGGTVVIIRGNGFTDVTGVLFGLMPSPSFTVVSPTEIHAIAPIGLGTVNVQVTSRFSASQTSSSTQFTYQGGPPGSSTIVQPVGGGDADLHNLAGQVSSFCANHDCQGGGYGPLDANAARMNSPVSSPGSPPPPAGITSPLNWINMGLATAGGAAALAACVAGGCELVALGLAGAGLGTAIYSLLNDPNAFCFLQTECHALIDPSGTIVDTFGNPLSGAIATVLRQNTSGGPFTPVLASSGAIEPAVNPQTTGPTGEFHWDALAGAYEVQASASGCHAPGDLGQADVFTPPFVIPPPKLGLLLTLQCPGSTPHAAAVTGLSANYGPSGGGNTIDILGTGLAGATAVRFGANPSTQFEILSPFAIKAVVPAGSATVDVRVDTQGGTSPVAAGDRYTYQTAVVASGGPTITAVTPSNGPLSGGTEVTIEGTHLGGAYEVDFGGTPSTQVTPMSATEVRAISPAAALAARVDITVTTPDGTSAPSSADTFAYGSPPPPLATTLTLSAGASPAFAGREVTFTAAVAPTDGGGSVAFYADGSATPLAGCAARLMSLSGSTYQASCATSGLAAGQHTIQAAYAGDNSYAASSGSTSITVVGSPASTALPAISGTPQNGQTLTCSAGAWSNSPDAYAFRWRRDGVDIGGATSATYGVQAADQEHTLTCVVTATNNAGSASASSAGVVVPAAPGPPPPGPPPPGSPPPGPPPPPPPPGAGAPANAGPPAIGGTPVVGQTLSASDGIWTGSAPISYAHQWQRCKPACADIPGATGATYALVTADSGAKVRVVVRASNSAGSAQAASNMVGPVASAGATPAQMRARLRTALLPSGRASRIGALLKNGGYSFSFAAPAAGSLAITWYHTTRGKLVSIATGAARFDSSRTTKVTIKLNAAGRRLLKRAKRVKLIAKGSFTPAGTKAVTAQRRFTITRSGGARPPATPRSLPRTRTRALGGG